jgi:hypothetical protein
LPIILCPIERLQLNHFRHNRSGNALAVFDLIDVGPTGGVLLEIPSPIVDRTPIAPAPDSIG